MAMIKFAPLRIPLRRRLQTLTVCLFMAGFIVAHLFSWFMVLFLACFPFFTVFIGAYLLWMFAVDRRKTPYQGGRAFPFLRRLPIWSYFRDYFPISLKRESELSPDGNYIFSCHPHGVASFGAFCNLATDATDFSALFPGLKMHLLTLNMLFDMPVWREVLMAFGLCSVSKESCLNCLGLGSGHSIAIMIGGAVEGLDARPNCFDLTLAKRKGFVKVAMLSGASLVPVFSFGENDVYEQWPNPRGSRLRQLQEKFVSALGFSLPIILGRGVFNYTFGLLPHRKPITTVIGSPIAVRKVDVVDEQEVVRVHSLYLEKLEELFDRHKADHGIANDQKLHFY